MNNKQILNQIEKNNNVIFKLQHTNKIKCKNLLFEDDLLGRCYRWNSLRS